MPVVAIARNTRDIHNNSGTDPISETGCAAVKNANGRHARYYVNFVIWGTGACGVVVAVNVRRMNFFLVYSFVK